jgi:hypothetical protein
MNRTERFIERVEKTELCWNWGGCVLRGGYGQFWDGTKKIYAHRYSYQIHRGPIPEGLVVDHLCRNRKCVNPEHLEAVSASENIRRGDFARVPGSDSRFTGVGIRKSHCIRGHNLEENATHTKGNPNFRRCRICNIIHQKKFQERKRLLK